MPNLCIIPARALSLEGMTGATLRVLCAIGLHTDREGAGCWASSKTLSEEAGVHRSRFFESVKFLRDAGLITVKSVPGKPSEYTIVLDKPTPRPVRSSGRVVSSPAGRGSPAQRDGTTINAPFNAPTTRDSLSRFPQQRPRHRDPYQPNDGPKAAGETITLVMSELRKKAAGVR